MKRTFYVHLWIQIHFLVVKKSLSITNLVTIKIMFLFFQALGIDPKNVKALYRMGKVIWIFKNSCTLQVYGLFEGCKQMDE